MRMHLRGYWSEKLKSGAIRHRVRPEGDKNRKITIPVGPDHPKFFDYYQAARRGEKPCDVPPEPKAVKQSLAWAGVKLYLAHLEREVAAELKSKLTLKQRRSLLTRFCAAEADDGGVYGGYDIAAPKKALKKLQLQMIETPAEADNMMKAVRAMYRHLNDIEEYDQNPAEGLGNIHRSKGGATPWDPEDLKKYREAHPPGTQAYLYLTILMFTGTRISDAILLGPPHEVTLNGRTYLKWQPVKRGSKEVMLPLIDPLRRAVAGTKVTGRDTYIFGTHGKPFKNPESMRVRYRKWCDEAGLEDRSSHGFRKALVEFLSESGMSSRQIMSVLSHTKAATSEIYTEKAERRLMAEQAMNAVDGFEW